MLAILLVVVATATAILGVLHIKWSFDGTYLRWAQDSANGDTPVTQHREEKES